MKRILLSLLSLTVLSCSAVFAQRGSLEAGAAKADITPSEASLPKTSYGILDHCYARAIVFSNGFNKAAFISFDAAMINAKLVEDIDSRAEKELGIPKGNIMYNWTHTHSGASVMGDELSDRTFEALRKACDNMTPAKVGFGSGVSYLNVKRDLFDPERGTWWEGPDYDGKSDKTVAVIYFESLEGKPIATYFNYAMHAVISGNLDMVSGDFPGAASRYVESAYGDDFVASFASGAAGDQNPIYFQQTFDLRDIRIADYAARGEDISNKMPPGGQGMDRSNPEVARLMGEQKRMVESYGQILGEEVKYVIMMMKKFETQVTISCSHKSVSVPARRQLNGGSRAGYAGEYEDAGEAQIDIHLTMIDDIPVVGTSGEPYNPIATRLKRESPFSRTMLTMLCQGVFTGYIPDDESYVAQSFEVLGSKFKQGYAESAIVNGALDLIHEASHQPTPQDGVASLRSDAHQLPHLPSEYREEASHQGTVVRLDYQTKTSDGQVLDKYTKVYLPYGYDQNDKSRKYNVFYLLHGGNGNPEHYWMWPNPSLKNILDHMIENGDMDPVIVVTPTYYPPERTSGGVEDVKIFHDELVRDIIPLVEGKFNTFARNTKAKGLSASRSHRAFGGFSLGAACTWWQLTQSLDYFKWFMPMSGDCWAVKSMGGPDKSPETAQYLIDNISKSKYASDYFVYAMTGDKDIAYQPMLSQMIELNKHPEFKFDDDFSKGNMYFSVMPGGVHSFEYINQYIYYALPFFFK